MESQPAGQQACSIQEKIDLEVRMQEGIWKLLSLSTQKDQILQAVKNLMVCNARITAYTSVLQKPQERIANGAARRDANFGGKERTACGGKIALSDIRIPLMWKDTDHFSNKERTQRYAIFCLFKMGAKVFDTDMVIVDPTVTDLCFENVSVLCTSFMCPKALKKKRAVSGLFPLLLQPHFIVIITQNQKQLGGSWEILCS